MCISILNWIEFKGTKTLKSILNILEGILFIKYCLQNSIFSFLLFDKSIFVKTNYPPSKLKSIYFLISVIIPKF
jgi:hypothetical protein